MHSTLKCCQLQIDQSSIKSDMNPSGCLLFSIRILLLIAISKIHPSSWSDVSPRIRLQKRYIEIYITSVFLMSPLTGLNQFCYSYPRLECAQRMEAWVNIDKWMSPESGDTRNLPLYQAHWIRRYDQDNLNIVCMLPVQFRGDRSDLDECGLFFGG